MKKKFFALMMAMVMVLSLAACGGGDDAQEETAGGETSGTEESSGAAFKIGVIGPMTGGAAIYGTCVANSAQIAVDEINALGGDIQFELLAPPTTSMTPRPPSTPTTT